MKPIPLSGMTLNLLAKDHGLVVDEELKKIAFDIEQRGHDGKPRELTINFKFKPKNGMLYIFPTISSKLPKQEPSIVQSKVAFGYDGKPHIVFNPENLESIDQSTIDDAIKEAEIKNREAE